MPSITQFARPDEEYEGWGWEESTDSISDKKRPGADVVSSDHEEAGKQRKQDNSEVNKVNVNSEFDSGKRRK